MPILASSTYVHGYGKSTGVVAVETAPSNLSSMQAGIDVFVVKYNTLGKALWTTRIASTETDVGYGITTDSAGNVYVSGQTGISAVVTLYKTDGTVGKVLSRSGNNDAFLVKYDTNGGVQWGARVASTGIEVSYGVATDSGGNVYITGSANFIITAFNSDETVFATAPTVSGGSDAFIVKYNTNGFAQWVARVASTTGEIGYSIATDSTGNVYVSGFGGTGGVTAIVTAFNSDGTSFATTLPNSGSYDAFFVKYNTSGFVQWVARVASSSQDTGFTIATDSANDVYLGGTAGSNVVFTAFNSDGTSFATTLPSSGGNDAFLVKYNTSGFVQWVARVASTGTDNGYSIATDSARNVYIVGHGGSGAVVTAFNSNGTAFATTLPNSGTFDAFLVKYNTSGFVQWVARIASSGSDIGFGVAIDSGSNIYVTGQGGASAVVTAFNSNGTAFGTTIANTGSNDAFLVKYNTSGLVQWITRLGSSGTDIGRAITVDSNSNVYVTGEFSGTQYSIYGQALSLFASIANAGGTDAFIVKYTTTGTPQWVARVTSTGSELSYGVSTDSTGNVYVTGQGGSGTITAFNSNGTAFATTIVNTGTTENFLVKYDTSGFVQWIARVGLSGPLVYSVATDSTGNVYVTGQGGNGQVFTAYNSNGTAFATTLANAGAQDAFLVKYNTSGFVQWVARVASTGTDIGFAITADSTGNVYVTGQGGSAAVVTAFNSNGTAFATTLPNSGGTDAFLVKYDTNGLVQWVARIGSSSGEIGYDIATDSGGNVYITGQGGNTVVTAFNSNGVGAYSINNAGGGDAFLVKYNTSGFVQWMARVTTTTADIGYSIATDPTGNVYITGQTGGGTITAFNSNGTTFPVTLPNTGGNDAFLVKYNTSGSVQWATRVASIGQDIGFGTATDSTGNIYLAISSGTFFTTIFSSNGERFAEVVGSSAIVKYDTNGFAKWVQIIRGTTSGVTTRSVATDTLGNVIITGNGASGESLQVFNADSTPYKVINAIGTGAAYVVKYSSTTIPLWVAKIDSSSANDLGFAIAADFSGNVYVTGQSDVVVTAFNSDGTAFATTLPNSGSNDAFLVKYDTNGLVQWVARIATTNNDIGYGVATDLSGNVYVGGWGGTPASPITAFNSNGTAFATTLPNSGNSDAFVVKYDTSGFVQWIAKIGSTSFDIGFAIATDSTGNVYITGQGGSAAVVTAFNSNGTAFATTLANSGSADAFLVKYNTSGFVQWVARVASTDADIAYAIATDSTGNVYITGKGGAAVVTAFNSNGTAFATTLLNAGLGDAFVVKYNTSGFVQWVTRVASNQADIGYGIAADSGGNVYVTGMGGSATVVVYSSDGFTFATLANLGQGDIFLVKYNTSGVAQWVARVGSNQPDIGYAITTDSAGSVYLTGQGGNAFSEGITAYNSNGTMFGSAAVTLLAGFSNSTFVVKYNSSGVVQWISIMDGSGNDLARGIAVDTSSNIYVTGQFGESALIPFSA